MNIEVCKLVEGNVKLSLVVKKFTHADTVDLHHSKA